MATASVTDLLEVQHSATSSIVHIYCNYQERETQSSFQILASILRALLRQAVQIPELVEEFFQESHARGKPMSKEHIALALRKSLSLFSRTYILIDALDELTDDCRRDLVSNLGKLHDDFTFNLLMTSRPSDPDDLKRHFPSFQESEIRASESDIRLYLKNNVWRLPKVVRKDPYLQVRVIATIAKTVDGM